MSGNLSSDNLLVDDDDTEHLRRSSIVSVQRGKPNAKIISSDDQDGVADDKIDPYLARLSLLSNSPVTSTSAVFTAITNDSISVTTSSFTIDAESVHHLGAITRRVLRSYLKKMLMRQKNLEAENVQLRTKLDEAAKNDDISSGHKDEELFSGFKKIVDVKNDILLDLTDEYEKLVRINRRLSKDVQEAESAANALEEKLAALKSTLRSNKRRSDSQNLRSILEKLELDKNYFDEDYWPLIQLVMDLSQTNNSLRLSNVDLQQRTYQAKEFLRTIVNFLMENGESAAIGEDNFEQSQ